MHRVSLVRRAAASSSTAGGGLGATFTSSAASASPSSSSSSPHPTSTASLATPPSPQQQPQLQSADATQSFTTCTEGRGRACPCPIPHPRVRAAYKELLVVCAHHPTFSLDKCRGKIKEAFARNAAIAVYSDGRGYTPGSAVVATDADFVDGEAQSCSGAGGDEAEVEEDEGLDMVAALRARRQDPNRAYSREFVRALSWARYAVKDTEALINLHKYRAMRARYGITEDDADDTKAAAGPKSAVSDGSV